jgi:hypothetical protein
MPHVPIVTGIATQAMPPMAMQQPAVTPLAAPDPVHHRQVEVKVTWGLAWGLFWRVCLLWIFLGGAAFLVYMLVRLILGYTSVF